MESMQILLLVDPRGRPRLSPRLYVDSVRLKRERAAFTEVS